MDLVSSIHSNRRIESDNSNRNSNGNASGYSPSSPTENCSLITLILSCTVATGVQFGWALQLLLLTPYIQTLGIGHGDESWLLCTGAVGCNVYPNSQNLCLATVIAELPLYRYVHRRMLLQRLCWFSQSF